MVYLLDGKEKIKEWMSERVEIIKLEPVLDGQRRAVVAPPNACNLAKYASATQAEGDDRANSGSAQICY